MWKNSNVILKCFAKNEIVKVKFQRERLQNIYRDKMKQSEHLNQLVQSFDAKMNKMRQNLRDISDKVCQFYNFFNIDKCHNNYSKSSNYVKYTAFSVCCC